MSLAALLLRTYYTSASLPRAEPGQSSPALIRHLPLPRITPNDCPLIEANRKIPASASSFSGAYSTLLLSESLLLPRRQYYVYAGQSIGRQQRTEPGQVSHHLRLAPVYSPIFVSMATERLC